MTPWNLVKKRDKLLGYCQIKYIILHKTSILINTKIHEDGCEWLLALKSLHSFSVKSKYILIFKTKTKPKETETFLEAFN